MKLCAALLILFAAESALASGKVAGKKYYEIDPGSHYATPGEACQFVAKKRGEDKSVDHPYNRVAGAKEDGGSIDCTLQDKDGDKNEQHYGSVVYACPEHASVMTDGCECDSAFHPAGAACVADDEAAGEKAASADPSVSSTDPCMDAGPRKGDDKHPVDNPPNAKRCPLSFRAHQLKWAIGAQGVSVLRSTICISEGVRKSDGKTVRLVSTNDAKLAAFLKSSKGEALMAPGEVLGWSPAKADSKRKGSELEHAEDAAQRWWKQNGDTTKKVTMGTDPRACQFCTEDYASGRPPYEWIRHERPDPAFLNNP